MNFSRWFKAQGADFLDMRLRQLPAGLFKSFYFLRCVAACNGGALPPVEKIAFLLGSRVPVVEKRLVALREAGLIAEREGELRIVEGEDQGAADAPAGEPLSGAERTKRWRERRAGEGVVSANEALGHGDEAVTPRDDIEIEKEADTDFPRVTREESLWERFDEFMAVFPARDDGPPSGPVVAAAWRKAIVETGARPDELIRAARAYGAAVAGRERRVHRLGGAMAVRGPLAR